MFEKLVSWKMSFFVFPKYAVWTETNWLCFVFIDLNQNNWNFIFSEVWSGQFPYSFLAIIAFTQSNYYDIPVWCKDNNVLR